MNLLFYAPDKIGAGRLLWQLNQALNSRVSSFICRDMAEFKTQLRKPFLGPTIAVLMAANIIDLKKLTMIKKLLHGLHIILILPDRRKRTLNLGHGLSPRFISYLDSDFNDVRDVLLRMIQNKTEEFR